MVSGYHGNAGIFEVSILLIALISVILYIVFSKPKKSKDYKISSNDDVNLWN